MGCANHPLRTHEAGVAACPLMGCLSRLYGASGRHGSPQADMDRLRPQKNLEIGHATVAPGPLICQPVVTTSWTPASQKKMVWALDPDLHCQIDV